MLHESMAGSPLITRTLREWRLTARDVSTDSNARALSAGSLLFLLNIMLTVGCHHRHADGGARCFSEAIRFRTST